MNPAARGHGKGPKSTPLIYDGAVYTLGIAGRLSAYNLKSGKVLWQKQFGSQYKSASPLYGTAVSPIAVGGMLIAHVGGHNTGALTAFDPKTGAVKWKWAEDGLSYATPVVATFGGVRQLFTQTQDAIAAFSLDGKLLWKIPFTTPYTQNIVTAIPYKRRSFCPATARKSSPSVQGRPGSKAGRLVLAPLQPVSTYSSETSQPRVAT